MSKITTSCYIKALRSSGDYVTEGKIYKVTNVLTNGPGIKFIDDQGQINGWHIKFFEYFPAGGTPLYRLLNEV